MSALIACLLAVPLWLPSCQAPSTPPGPKIVHHLKVQGLERTYRVFQPAGLSSDRAAPLVFAFHGGSGNAKQAQRHYGFDVLAQKHGFLVVYPEAIDGHWNDGRNGEKFAVQNRTVDDVAYFRAVLKQVKADHKVDTDRIYAMGASNGGMFVQRLALEETGTFAAVASTISSLPKPLKPGFKPKAPLSVLFLSGTEDPILPFEGGEVVFRLFGGEKKRRWEKSRGHVLPVREAAKLWVAHNQITSKEQDTRLADVDPTDGCRVRQRIWKSEKGPTVVLYEIENGGHTLPQLKSKVPKRLVGRTCQDIHTTETIWAFFADKKRRKAEAEIQPPATGE